MKKQYLMIALLSFTCLFTGCGNNLLKSKEILPTRIEAVNQEGKIPEKCAAKEHVQKYDPAMLVGEWVLEGSYSNENLHPTEEMVTIGSGKEKTSMECLPVSFRFEYMEEGSLKSKLFAENHVGYGTMQYYNDASIIDLPGIADVIYDTAEDILSVGIISPNLDFEENTVLDMEGNMIQDIDITEIDYKMSWNGYKLTLSYKDESAVYVPEYVASSASGTGVQLGIIGGCSLMPGQTPFAGILSLSKSREESRGKLIYDAGNNTADSMDVDLEFDEQGVLSIDVGDGNSYQCEYLYAGDTLTLISGEDNAVYSAHVDAPQIAFQIDPIDTNMDELEKSIEEFSEKVEEDARESNSRMLRGDIKLNGNAVNISADTTVIEILEEGFTTDIDVTRKVPSCEITEEFVLYANQAELRIKAINPYEKEIPIEQCMICSTVITDTTGTITTEDDFQCGVTSLTDIKEYFAAPYKESEDTLVYKGNRMSRIKMVDFSHDFGEQLIEEGEEVDISYNFEAGILNSIKVEQPALLYNGLQNNVESEVLRTMEQSKFSGIIEVRDSILDEIKKAMEASGVEVKIDAKTGEIVMDTTVLFATDKYELTEQGKQYLDTFFRAYASVILDEDFSTSISEVVFEGHTDTSGSYDYNLTLSQKRANAVLEYCLGMLTAEEKDQLSRITNAVGYSFSDPVYTEDGKVDMDGSRRVTIKFFVNVDNI